MTFISNRELAVAEQERAEEKEAVLIEEGREEGSVELPDNAD